MRPRTRLAVGQAWVSAFAALSLLALAAAVKGYGPSAALPAGLAAADFVVTSARDAGPNTLRDAILAADRLSSHARIQVKVKDILIDSGLPALVNPHGIDIDTDVASTIDAAGQTSGAVFHIDSTRSTLRGLRVVNARNFAFLVNAADVRLDSISVLSSKVGVLLNSSAQGCLIRSSLFERDATGLMIDAGLRDASVVGDIFRDSSRAGVWLVGAPATRTGPSGELGSEQPHVRIIDDVFEDNVFGVVLANQPTLIQKGRFIDSGQSAVLILGGSARIEDSEIRDSGANAISVTGGQSVVIAHNVLIDNRATAISVRDSDVVIERNTLTHNSFGIVSIISNGIVSTLIDDNLITRSTSDAITVIGGTSVLQRNQVLDNRGAALRALDLVEGRRASKAEPQLQANVFKGNLFDAPIHGAYKLSGAP